MKHWFVRICYHALSLMGLASLFSCSEGGLIFTGTCEYGTPHADFELKGKVKDMDDNPIKGISVYCIGEEEAPVFTSADGSFVIRGDFFPRETMDVAFEDVDGEDNGGQFERKVVQIELESSEEGDGHWDFGEYVGEIEVKL